MSENIQLIEVKHNNLKNINVSIPRNKFTVITGVSGSGKSSLAFDTLYAEGQRRYIESFSAYARQFLGKIPKPDVKNILNLPPAVAIQQKVASNNQRSTVGTMSEIYDFFKLLYAKIGKTYTPEGEEVKKHTVEDILKFISSLKLNTEILILSHFDDITEKKHLQVIDEFIKDGYSRFFDPIKKEVHRLEEFTEYQIKNKTNTLCLVLEKIECLPENEQYYYDSVQNAFNLSNGVCEIYDYSTNLLHHFSDQYELHKVYYPMPTIHLFDFNSPLGACPNCEGFGKSVYLDEELIIPNKLKSVADGAIAPWQTEKMKEWQYDFILKSKDVDFPIYKPYFELSKEEKNILWNGTKKIPGITQFFKMVESNLYKIQYRVLFSKYRSYTTCPICKGNRLKIETLNVKINNKTITDWVDMPLDEMYKNVQKIKLSPNEKIIGERPLQEIITRAKTLIDLGLSYLQLSRISSTLSGGEYQRVNLAKCLNSQLVGTLYVLDEPSIGLHTKDTNNLLHTIRNLMEIGNTVVVVEHDDFIVQNSDYLVDIGPNAGNLGGELLFQGETKDFIKNPPSNSLTAKYLHDKSLIMPNKSKNIVSDDYIEFKGAYAKNIQNLDLDVPLNQIVTITGVSGSGKSTLVREILYPALIRKYQREVRMKEPIVSHFEVHSALLSNVMFIDQNPIGKSNRSNPITYLGIYDDIRLLFASAPLAKQNKVTAGNFSFNTDGGRCSICKGLGTVTLEMQFLSDIEMVCEGCDGKRFQEDILEITISDKNVFEVLELTIQEAYDFFVEINQEQIFKKLGFLVEVGLGYLLMGQSSNKLSGGEAQRVKLAHFLCQSREYKNTLFIFDEPTTGLHNYDISILLHCLQKLLSNSNSLLLIEHNLQVVNQSDYIIDIGPEAGIHGGKIVGLGTPEHIATLDTHTGKALKEFLEQ